MKILFHGDNLANSRHNLNQALDQAKAKGVQIRTIDGYKITYPELETAISSANLFNDEAIVIENLFSRPVGSERKRLIELIKNYHGPKNLYFWDKKEVTKAVINSASSSNLPLQSNLSKAPAIIFSFLDSIKPGNKEIALSLLHESSDQVDEVFVFIMLSGLVADLIVAQSGDTSTLIPFKRSRLISQSSKFPPNSLFEFHTSLLSIDRAIKTGQTKLSYLEHLDLLLNNLLN